MKELNIQVPEGYEIDQERSTFEKIIFKKKCSYPKSWEEFCETNPSVQGEYYIASNSNIIRDTASYNRVSIDKNHCKTVEEAEAFLALLQLKRLWHEYTYNWSENLESIWSIGYTPNSGFLLFSTVCNNSSMFFFPNKKLAEEFFNNFNDLFIKTEPLYK